MIWLSFKRIKIDTVNKSTKIRLNYLFGGAISLLLLYCIYRQVVGQLHGIDAGAWRQTAAPGYLLVCIVLMFINTSLEGSKWYLLARSVADVSYIRAFCSYLVGIAFSIITPNRIGEYPGRILYLGGGNTFRYISISVLGISAQLSAIYIFGFAGLIYYNIVFPALMAKVALGVCIVVNVIAALVYWRFEEWLPRLVQIRWLRRFAMYGMLLNRITTRRQIMVLTISLLRFAVFTAQYLFLLRWMNVKVPLAEGFCMAALFFWIISVIPSVALAGLGVRGTVSLYLFHHFSSNSVGILAATVGIWLLNLILPSILGSFLILRMRLLR